VDWIHFWNVFGQLRISLRLIIFRCHLLSCRVVEFVLSYRFLNFWISLWSQASSVVRIYLDGEQLWIDKWLVGCWISVSWHKPLGKHCSNSSRSSCPSAVICGFRMVAQRSKSFSLGWTTQDGLINKKIPVAHARYFLSEVNRIKFKIIALLPFVVTTVRSRHSCPQSTVNCMDFNSYKLLQIPGISQLLVILLAALPILTQKCLMGSNLRGWSLGIWKLKRLLLSLLLELWPGLGTAHEYIRVHSFWAQRNWLLHHCRPNLKFLENKLI